MKNLKLLTLFLMIAFVLTSCGKKDEPVTGDEDAEESTEEIATGMDGDVNSFIVKYKVEGGIMDGSVTSIAHGKNFKTIVVFDMAGQKLETSTFSSNDSVYIMMDMGFMKENVVMSIANFKDESGDDPTQMDITQLQEELKKHTKLGTETILGKLCQIYDLGDGMLMSVYDDKIPLKIQSKEMTLVATEYEANPKLPDDTFSPPAGVTFKSISSMRDLGGQ